VEGVLRFVLDPVKGPGDFHARSIMFVKKIKEKLEKQKKKRRRMMPCK